MPASPCTTAVLVSILGAASLVGCDGAADGRTGAEDCPTEPHPSVRLGNTEEGFVPLTGELPAVDVVLGGQGSFHIALSLWMEGFCRVVSFNTEMALADAVGGARTTVHRAELRMEMIRPEPGDDGFDPEHPSAQFVAGQRAFVPCAYYPHDPGTAGERCTEPPSSLGFIDDGVALLAVEVEDREGHSASAAVWVRPEYTPAR